MGGEFFLASPDKGHETNDNGGLRFADNGQQTTDNREASQVLRQNYGNMAI